VLSASAVHRRGVQVCATTRSGPGTDVVVVPTRIPVPRERRGSGGEEKRIAFVFGHPAPDAESFAAPNGGASAVLEYRALGTDLYGLLLTSAASVATLVVGRKNSSGSDVRQRAAYCQAQSTSSARDEGYW
jgi:hypothetical protein